MSRPGSRPEWMKRLPSFANGNCREVADLSGGEIGVRDSREAAGAVFPFPSDRWHAFLSGVKNNGFDRSSVREGARGAPRSRPRSRHASRHPALPSSGKLKVMTVIWGWMLKKLVYGRQGTGFFCYLASRDRNRTRIKLEKTRKEATGDIIEHLPNGAVYREGTPDGWREILMPDALQHKLFVLAEEHDAPAQYPHDPAGLPTRKSLGSDDESDQSDCSKQLPPP